MNNKEYHMASAGNDNAQVGVDVTKKVTELQNAVEKRQRYIQGAKVINFKMSAEEIKDDDSIKYGIKHGSVFLVEAIMSQSTEGEVKTWMDCIIRLKK